MPAISSKQSSLPKAGDDSTLYVLDLSGYVFRAYHALPELSNEQGEPTHAVYGTTNMLRKLLQDCKPKLFAVAMDSRGPSFRHEMFAKYKANRPPPPPDLSQQMERVRQIVEAHRFVTISKPSVEADDIIATLVRDARGAGLKVVIVSADKDLLQLVGDDVVMFDSMRNKVFDAKATQDKMGVPPAQVRDLLALTGDSSDNVPGVPSVGPKTAAKLLSEFGSLEAIYDHLDKVSGKSLKSKLQEHKDQAFLSQRLVTLKNDVSLGVEVEQCRVTAVDEPALHALYQELGFSKLAGEIIAPPAEKLDIELVLSSNDAIAAFDLLQSAKQIVAIPFVERAGRSPLLALGLAAIDSQQNKLSRAFCFLPSAGPLSIVQLAEQVKELIDNAQRELCVTDAKMLCLATGVSPFASAKLTDLMLASYLLESDQRGHDLAALGQRYLGENVPAEGELLKDLHTTQQSLVGQSDHSELGSLVAKRLMMVATLAPMLEAKLKEQKLWEVYAELELPLAKVLSKMEWVGIRLDTEVLNHLSSEASVKMIELEKKCHALAGKSFNVNSPRQLETVLFDDLGLAVIKRTKTARSTNQDVLEQLSLEHDLPSTILEYRSLAKLQSTYLDALPRQVNPKTGRVHTQFNQAVAATGRLSSSDPNLQNIPIRTELGRAVRKAFIPEDGWLIFSADYSQIELRVLAHLSKDKELCAAFIND
ncbi:MAG: DNA polymerase I [Myxococcales bacterium]|nr:MAG: DNA polymerase I [Myxococcales bacterium]